MNPIDPDLLTHLEKIYQDHFYEDGRNDPPYLADVRFDWKGGFVVRVYWDQEQLSPGTKYRQPTMKLICTAVVCSEATENVYLVREPASVWRLRP